MINFVNNIDDYFKYLSFLYLNPLKEKHADSFMAAKSDSKLAYTNRVFIPDRITTQDLDSLKAYYNDLPFTIWLNETNKNGNKDMQDLGFKSNALFPLMEIDLKNVTKYSANSAVTVNLIPDDKDILTIWVSLAARAFNITAEDEFQKFIQYLLLSSQRDNMQFYIGYYNNKPAAVSMLILKESIAGVHWVATLSEYRKKGLGKAVSCLPLQTIKSKVSKAILYASEMGKPLYEQIGFSVIATSVVYVCQF